MKRTMLVLACLVACGACTAHHRPLETVSEVDLARYQGTWHEIARLPNWFQKECIRSRATYRLTEAGEITVLNECETSPGSLKAAHGTAVVVDRETNAKLNVVFHNWFSRLFPFLAKGKYWILYLDDDYTTVIVGTPDRKYLWILARTPDLDEAVYQDLVRRCAALSFDTTRLIRAPGTRQR